MKEQYKHLRINQTGTLFSHICEHKNYLEIIVIPLDSAKFAKKEYRKRYYEIKSSFIIKYFFASDTIFFFYLKNDIYYLDTLLITNNGIKTKKAFRTSMRNCNLFLCGNLCMLSTFSISSSKTESTLYICDTQNFTFRKFAYIPGIVERIGCSKKTIYVNLKDANGLREIHCIDRKSKHSSVIENGSKISYELLDVNEKHMLIKAIVFGKEICFLKSIESNTFFVNITSLMPNHIQYIKLCGDFLCVISDNGCNDELNTININDRHVQSIQNCGSIPCQASYHNNCLVYFQQTYKSFKCCKYTFLSFENSIMFEKQYTINAHMCAEHVALDKRTLEILHYYCIGYKKGVVLYLHGGPSSRCKNEYNRLFDFLSMAGFDIICLNYRGSTGYGKEFEIQIDGNWGVAELDDVIEIAKIFSCDNNILLGESYGAFLCLHAIRKEPTLWKKCCMFAPFISPLSMYNNPDNLYKSFFARQIKSVDKQYTDDSMIYDFKKSSCLLLLIHGIFDNIVPISGSKHIIDLLQKASKIENKDYWFIEGDFGHEIQYNSEYSLFENHLRDFLNSSS